MEARYQLMLRKFCRHLANCLAGIQFQAFLDSKDSVFLSDMMSELVLNQILGKNGVLASFYDSFQTPNFFLILN